jgi:DNA-binding NtrC family response regulator
MKSVVVVQRLSDFADEFANWLGDAGYRVRVCTGPTMPAFRCWSTTFNDCPLWQQADLMIYDPWIQTGSGSFGSGAILKLERQRHPAMPILIWGSGAAVPSDVASMEDPGHVEFLPMEITPRELVAAVENLIGPAADGAVHH